jgi:hypothetical protein
MTPPSVAPSAIAAPSFTVVASPVDPSGPGGVNPDPLLLEPHAAHARSAIEANVRVTRRIRVVPAMWQSYRATASRPVSIAFHLREIRG